jgi:hypothetical protein
MEARLTRAGVPAMTQLDIDRLSDNDLTELTMRLCQQFMSRKHVALPLAIPGNDQKPVGFLVSVPSENCADIDPDFLAELRRRIKSPPNHYLTVEEFFAALDADPSPIPSV